VGGAAAVLAEPVAEQGDATLAEYADRLAGRAGVRRSLASVCRALKRLGLARKKRRSGPPSRTGRMSPRRGRPGVPTSPGSIRAGWSSSTLGSGAAEGIDTRLTRSRARAPRGHRALGKVPWGSTAALSMGAADHHRRPRPGGCGGVHEHRRRDQHRRVPGLRRGGAGAGPARPARRDRGHGHWTAPPSRAAHKADAVRGALDRAGLSHRYLPPYSPDLNPVEQAWSKLRARLRAEGARSREALEAVLGSALATITAQDASAWFRLAGYPAPAN
jgi:hypothetical protein